VKRRLSSTPTEAGAHAKDARRRSHARDARRRPGRARLGLAGRGSCASPVLRRLRSLCRRAAPRHRHRRAGRHGGARTCVRGRLLRGLAAARRAVADDPNRRRVLGHAAPARRDTRRTRRRGRGGRRRGAQRRERRPGEHRAARPPRRAGHGRRGWLRRPDRAPACVGARAGGRAHRRDRPNSSRGH